MHSVNTCMCVYFFKHFTLSVCVFWRFFSGATSQIVTFAARQEGAVGNLLEQLVYIRALGKLPKLICVMLV